MEKPKENSHLKNEEDFSKLIKEYDLKSISYDSPVKGTIIDIMDNDIIIDIGQKTEGILKKEELFDWDSSFNYKIGDTVTVICQKVNRKQGYITVSKKELDISEGWEKVINSYENNISVLGKIIRVVHDNKGFIVDLGVQMFLPMSQADIKKIKNPQHLLGKEFWFKITKLNSKDKTGVISRKVILEEEKKEKIKQLFNSLQVGDIIKGVVSSITDYGAFVNIGGIDGLIHRDNISYGRINHPREKLRNGDEVEVKILDIDKERQKISLGIKQKYPDPWIDIDKKYPPGKKVIAKVTKIVDFGAFIELEEGVEGLLHISDLTWEGKPSSVEEYVAVGDKLWVQIVDLNKEEKRIKMGLKQLEMRPEEKYLEKHSSGEIVKGMVKKILKSRVFISLDKNVEGMVRISDISYFRIDSPKEFLSEGEEVETMILSDELDSNYKVKLGLKHLSDGEWRDFFNLYKPGSIIPIKIKKIIEQGIHVEISKNIEGFVK
ncbi:MAG: S1 RNA-binding domain-containing protein, partial [Candidatus Aminicenantes bacterium]|nr:S1 RNA-binding domain-containing protein [Candidatus Aminicenantes bacterium]